MPTAVKTQKFNVPDIVSLPFETVKLPLETVKAPAVLNVPVIDELPVILNPPYETVNGLLHVNPLQVIGAVGSTEIHHFPKLIPES